MFASIVAGTLVYLNKFEEKRWYYQHLLFAQFALGWWAVIDACAEYSEAKTAAYHICGIFSTIALLM